MRAVKSAEDLKRREGGCYLSDILTVPCIGQYLRKTISLESMSTPGVMTSNLSKLRHSQTSEKLLKRKDIFRNKIKKDGPNEPIPIGDNLEVCNAYENFTKEAKDGSRPSTASRVRGNVKEPLNGTRESNPMSGDYCKKCSVPVQHGDKSMTYGDEGFYDDEQSQPKQTVIDEVKELIRKSVGQRAHLNENLSKGEMHTTLSSDKPKKRLWVAVLVWLFTFTGALAFYFSLFVYTYQFEPVYTAVLEMLGWKEEVPPPPPTIKEQIFQMLEHIGNKLYDFNFYLLEKITFHQFQKKS